MGLLMRTALVAGWMLVLHIPGGRTCRGNTCGQCIASGGDCAWCADTNFKNSSSDAAGRCALVKDLRASNCSEIQNPRTEEVLAFKQDKQVTDGEDGTGDDAIQLQPQAMKVRIRPKDKEFRFVVTFRPANNFPVDLYFLFDVSRTMDQSIRALATLANQIATEIGSISTNYRMGYGTFQDKVILPFTNTHPAKLQNPCTNSEPCKPAFSFRHELPMTKDLNSFKKAVTESNITGNIDRPEGGLDAMMQAIVCRTVGWRNNSRQLIIFGSDARMHFAGDGKLAGLVTPNDGNCHLKDGHTDSMAEKQDYPSVGQIAYELDRSKKYVIFAVSSEVYPEYQRLQVQVPRSSANILREGKNSNVVQIVRDTYRNMTKGAELEYKVSSSNVEVTIYPKCPKLEGKRCTEVTIGDRILFEVGLRVLSCPEKESDRIQTVTIAPSDFLLDRLNVTVEIICSCECENVTRVPSNDCSYGNGSLLCGVCACNKGRTGSTCECGLQEQEAQVEDNSCIPGGNASAAQECNGPQVGHCVCGVCICNPGYSGRYCECNDMACAASENGLVCGGNGACRCGKCECNENYSGHTCTCPLANDTCIDPGTKADGASKVCSSHGVCECGSCKCEKGYSGKHCAECALCGKSVCDINWDCAQCNLGRQDSPKCPENCPPVKKVLDVDAGAPSGCTEVVDSCFARFSVVDIDGNTTILMQDDLVCPKDVNLWIVVGGVVGGVVLVGLLLLMLWKILTLMFDKMEYARFEKELQKPNWAKENNPLYKEVTTTYFNPTVDPGPGSEDF